MPALPVIDISPVLADEVLEVRPRANRDVADAHHRDLLDAGTWSS